MKKQILLYFSVILFISLSFGQTPKNIPTPQWRPVYHFTPAKNWTNDPNGLVYLNGEFHLYNQQNPFENKWGHMSWGHATSKDLIHWNHLPIAIPEKIDKDTTWIFSGSAVLDKNNTSGFCKTKDCIVAIYTADQPNLKKESQFIAYSNDSGKSFTNYENNPVIDLQLKDFRDPNVFWYEQTKKWIMSVALPAQHKVRFYASPDLKNWTLLSDFGPQGFTNAAWECPFLIQLPVKGIMGVQKWVLGVSAAGRERGTYMQYFVGDFDGTKFTNDNTETTILDLDDGDCFYAAIPWNNAPDNQKILIGWMVPKQKETYPWKGQMSIPRDLSVREANGKFYLTQQPAAIIKNNLLNLSGNKNIILQDKKINNSDLAIVEKNISEGNSYWLEAEFTVEPGTISGFKIAQQKDDNKKLVNGAEIGFDVNKKQVYVKRSPTELPIKTMDVQAIGGKIKLEILVDKSSLEVFVNNGEQVLTTYFFPNEKENHLSFFASNGSAVINDLKAWNLSGIKNN